MRPDFPSSLDLKSFLQKKPKELTRYRTTGPSKSNQKTMSTQLENESSFDDSFFHQNLSQYYRSILKNFRTITQSFVAFKWGGLALLTVEIALFLTFLPVFSRSALLAVALGVLFLTFFSYLVLLFYFQARKPEQLEELKEKFLQSCRQLLPLPPGEAQHHLSLATALFRLSAYLEGFEWNLYAGAKGSKTLSRLFTRFSAHQHWEDVFNLKQLLLQTAIDEHLRQVRITPTDLEVHASLANTYVALSQIYLFPQQEHAEHPCLGKYLKNQAYFEEKFRQAASLAIEEFRILSHYAPNDPWVHEQLATGYRALRMPEEEVHEVELLLKLRPQDKEILFRLGTLYFEQGQNAKGLQVYEELKQAHYKKAEDLIAAYGTLEG